MDYKLCILVVVLVNIAYVHCGTGVPGGLSDEKTVNGEVRSIVKQLHKSIEKSSNKQIESIEPLTYKSQVVAGTNYFIKALITEKNGKKAHAHIRIYKHFRDDAELTAVLTDLDESTPLRYFQ